MDSTETPQGPTVSLTFEDVGLTPRYLKTTIEDLANDQISMEKAIASNRTMGLIAMGAGLMGIGFGLLAVKMGKLVVNNMQELGGAVLTTQQYVGMIPSPPAPVVAEPVHRESDKTVVADDAVVIGEGYDPGPQDVPEEVRRAVEELPVSDWLDEDGV